MTKTEWKRYPTCCNLSKWLFLDFLESGIWKFQENENSKIPSEKSNSVTKTEWEKYPISCNLSNAAISREFPDFLESGNLEILEVPKNAKKYSKIDLIISFF